MNRQYNRRIRIAHISLGLETGGLERLLVELVRHSDRSRFEVTVISLTGRGRLAAAIERAGGRVLTLNAPHGVRLEIIFRLWRLLRAEAFDVVHTHDERPLTYGAPAAWLAGISVRVHTHHHGRLSSTTWKERLLLRATARYVNPFVCVSEDSTRYVSSLGVEPRRLRTLWNGVDLVQYKFSGPNVAGPAVCIARLCAEKGYKTLLQAVRKVVDLEPTFRLEIAGDGPLREEIRWEIAKLKLHQNVRLLGEVSDVPALLENARVFVLPSLSEGISLTILEAMAAGLPVVATQVGGNPEVVQDGVTGLLVRCEDPSELGKALLSVFEDPDKARRLGIASRKRVEKNFDVRQMVRHYESLYADAAKRESHLYPK